VSANSSDLPAVAVAVLVAGGCYVLQHRDEDPGIAWAGHWGLFGGGIEPGEAPEVAVVRELEEELALRVPTCRLFWSSDEHRDGHGRRRTIFVFEADITAAWGTHRLGEGQGVGLFHADRLPSPIVPMARAMIERHWRALGA
jgi:8-oxo-dGTP pyrophosphatase MutT (NUDIX family)